jgi:TRAP-type C4-dicarboxylate transport system permease large subunit
MTVVYIVCGILLYFLVAGITTAILGRALPEDAELLAIFLSAIWPLALPVYILGQVFGLGRTLTEKLLNRNLKSTDK